MYLDAVNYSTETEIGGTAASGRHKTEVFARWSDWPPSVISHHGEMCCEVAREWLTAMDFSELNGAALTSGPRWLRARFKWGASSFPIYWCEAVERTTLDCGALAALTHEIFASRGVTSYRVQMVQRFSEDSARQWNNSWSESGVPLNWIDGQMIYHEGCAIQVPRSGDRSGIVSHLHAAKSQLNSNGNGHKYNGKVIDFEQHRIDHQSSAQLHENLSCPAVSHLEGTQITIWDSSAGWWCDPCVTDGYGAIVALRVSGDHGGLSFRWGRHVLRPDTWTGIK